MTSQMHRREFLRTAVSRIIPAPRRDDIEEARDWAQRFIDFVNNAEPGTNLIVGLPEFRPDIVHYLASRITFRVYDFRAEVMAKRSWQAHEITVSELTAHLRTEADTSNVIAFNVEALLSTKTVVERKHWFRAFRSERFANRAIAVATLYCDALDASDPGILLYQAGSVPEHGLLQRMFEVSSEKPRKAHHVMLLES